MLSPEEKAAIYDKFYPEAGAHPHRGWLFWAEERGEFIRDENDLVDIQLNYSHVLYHDPDSIPTQVTPAMREWLIHQHLYFWDELYAQKDTPLNLRDEALADFRRSEYNQLIMDPTEEQGVHRRRTRVVSPPDPEFIKGFLEDAKLLDVAGAAALGRRVTLVPEAVDGFAPSEGLPKSTKKYTIGERLAYYDTELERAIRVLRDPLVMPQRVVTGALSRMARMIQNHRLEVEVARRLEIDPVYYPVRIRKPGFLYTLSNTMLQDMKVHYLPLRTYSVETDAEAGQSEVDQLELEAA